MNNKGTIIIEVFVSIFILTVGILGVFAFLNQPIEQTGNSISILRAYYLAQEGIELVRNERDKIYLQDESWSKNNLDIKADYLRGPVGGTDFEREIVIEEIDENTIKVKIKVFWSNRGKNQEVNVQENLYNWL